jgi:hypothetical protein
MPHCWKRSSLPGICRLRFRLPLTERGHNRQIPGKEDRFQQCGILLAQEGYFTVPAPQNVDHQRRRGNDEIGK